MQEIKTAYANPKAARILGFNIYYLVGGFAIILAILAAWRFYRKFKLPKSLALAIAALIFALLTNPAFADTQNVRFIHQTEEAGFECRLTSEGNIACANLFLMDIRNFASLDLIQPGQVWLPGNTYLLDEVTAGEYIMTGGAWDSPPFYLTKDSAYTDRIRLQELIELGGYEIVIATDTRRSGEENRNIVYFHPEAVNDEFEFFYQSVTNAYTALPVGGISCDNLGNCTVSPFATPGIYEITLTRNLSRGVARITRDAGATIIEQCVAGVSGGGLININCERQPPHPITLTSTTRVTVAGLPTPTPTPTGGTPTPTGSPSPSPSPTPTGSPLPSPPPPVDCPGEE